MWYDEAVVYQIYPLGLCGAPLQNDVDPAQAGEHRILRVLDWVEHIKRLGATCADYLTKKGMPFRDAYKCTGTMVAACIREGKTLEELTLDEFKQYSDLFEDDVYTAIDLTTCCEGRTSYGGPTKASVMKQVADVKGKLA